MYYIVYNDVKKYTFVYLHIVYKKFMLCQYFS